MDMGEIDFNLPADYAPLMEERMRKPQDTGTS